MKLLETYIKLNESTQSAKKLLSYDIKNLKEKLKQYQLIDKRIDRIEKYFDSIDRSIDLSLSNDGEDKFDLSIYVIDAKDQGEMKDHLKKISKILLNALNDTTNNDISHGLLKYILKLY